MKLKILIFCLLTATFNVSVAQKGNDKILIPAGVGDKVGFIDLKGKWIINPQYEKVEEFQDNGLAGVMLNGKWGWIDKTGKMVIEPKYDYIDYFENGLAIVELNDESYSVDVNGNRVDRHPAYNSYGLVQTKKWDENSYIYGLVDRTGKTIIEPRFLHIGSFSNGLASVIIYGADSYCKYGYIDTTGKISIAAKYEYANSFTQNGLARVKLHGKWGVIDTTGKNVIEPTFAYASPFRGGYSILSDSIRVDGYYKGDYMRVFGYVDSTGKIFEFDNKYELSEWHSIPCDDYHSAYSIGGTWTPEPDYDVNNYDGGLFGVKFTEKWGFINNKGMIVIRPQFDEIGSTHFSTSEPLNAVKINDKWGYIDRKGNFVIEPQYDEAGYGFGKFSYYGLDLAVVSIGENKYLIDKSGKIFSSEMQQFYRLNLIDGILITRKINEDKESQEWGYISKKGKYKVIPTQNIDWLIYEGTNNISED